MADVDLTSKSFGVAGVNAATNFTKSYAYRVDFEEADADLKKAGTHTLFEVPAGEAVVGIKTVPLETAVPSGTVNVQFGFKSGTASAVTFGSAATATVLNKVYVVDGAGDYSGTDSGKVVMVVTSGGTIGNVDLLFEVDTIPAKAFVTKG